MPIDPPPLTPTVPPEHAHALDAALQNALRAPVLPDGFRARVLHAAQQAHLRDVAEQKRTLALEHAQARAHLHRSYVRLRRDTLALIVVVAFAAGALANLALPWLQSAMAIDRVVSAPVLALVIGLCAGASVWRDRFSD